jgi:hypothetical protein
MPQQILITSSRKTSLLNRVKAVLIAVLGLSLAVGVLMTAFLLGIAIAGLILLGICLACCALLVSRIWKRRQRGHSEEWPR